MNEQDPYRWYSVEELQFALQQEKDMKAVCLASCQEAIKDRDRYAMAAISANKSLLTYLAVAAIATITALIAVWN